MVFTAVGVDGEAEAGIDLASDIIGEDPLSVLQANKIKPIENATNASRARLIIILVIFW
jgi:hypothetical protein